VAVKEEDPRRFLHPNTIAQISRLDLRARHAVEGFISGMHKSPFFGHTVEFKQHREYVVGDDFRYLDWKVWSKTDRFYIKQFEAETNLRTTVVLDVSESMHYGPKIGGVRREGLDKYNYGCTIGACLAYLLIRQQDSVGLITFDDKVRQIVPSRSQQQHLDAVCKAMDVSRPREKTDILSILRRVTESVSGRGLVVIVSDLLVDREPLLKGLEMLCQRKHDILVFHVLDDDELSFPFSGTTKFEGMEEMPDLVCDPRALRDGYIEALEEYLTEVRRGCTRLGIDYQLVRTGEYLDAMLAKYLHFRAAARSTTHNRGPR
jgi:uncharacterized protein (DUF58 family)